ncbi:MAG: hypothetical protein IMY72_12165 [Bacteroidetes bacterium]|nr:hypothetical protein [Bacteroidota bacterium]
MSVTNKYLNINKKLVYIILCLFSIFIIYASQQIIPIKDIYYKNLGEQLSTEKIKHILSISEKWMWLNYIITPFAFAIKFSLVALVLNIGAILCNFKVGFKKLFGIVLLAEPIFILSSLSKLLWIYFNSHNLTLEYLQFFYPLSLTNLFLVNEVPKWLIYPFQTINLFEISYWFIIAYLLKDIIKKPFWKSFEFILSTYGVGLFIWVVCVIFLILTFS